MKAHYLCGHRCRTSIVALALLALPACAPSSDGDTRPATPSAPIPLFQLTTSQRDDLLFPALRRSDTAWSPPCGKKPATGPAPAWLEQALATASCTTALREIVHARSHASHGTATDLQERLTAAALCDDIPAIRRLLTAGARPDRRDSCGSTALVTAATVGKRRAVGALLAAGANPNTASRQGPRSRTPLLAAAIGGHTKTAVALLDGGADPNVVTRQGRDALMYATANKDEDLVRKLLRRRADACRRDELGLTALAVAGVYGAEEVGKLLVEASQRCGRTRKRAR